MTMILISKTPAAFRCFDKNWHSHFCARNTLSSCQSKH